MGINSPAEIAKNYVAIGKAKVNLAIDKMFILAVVAGAFIAFGGVGAATAAVGVMPSSVGKLISGCIFPGGLTMVLLAGSELFTGNCLLSIPLLEKEITLKQLLRNWIVVYFGNMAGGMLVAAGLVYSGQYNMFDGNMAVSVFSTAAAKCTLTFSDAFIKGIFCNIIVCIAVWVAYSAKDSAGKVISLFFPILIFVICGFEHCVANMYYISAGLFGKNVPSYVAAAKAAGVNLNVITWKNFFITNLVPVTLGNIVGGAVCVGAVYRYVYLRKVK